MKPRETRRGAGLGASISALVGDVQRLVQLEMELARQEIKGLLRRNGIAAGMLVGAALSVLFFLIFGQVWLIVFLPHHAIVAGAVAVFWLLAGLILGLTGKSRLKIELPTATLQTLKDDVEWVKQQIRQLPK
ncbi:MAG: hypothetical protein NVSMB32_03890 [Actinomycetota bacterium]